MRGALLLALFRFALRIDLGPEFDSNANRAELYRTPPPVTPGDSPPPQPAASFLVRSLLGTNLIAAHGPHLLRLGLQGGGKFFLTSAAAPQDTAVGQAQVAWRIRLAAPVLLLFAGDYYDALQWNRCPDLIAGGQPFGDRSCHRDFRSLGGHATTELLHEPYSLSLSGGARLFHWKPDDALSFSSLFGQATISAHLRCGEHEWDLATSGRIDRRDYHGLALVSPSDLEGTTRRRLDSDAQWNLSLAYVGPVLIEGSYAVDFNRSTSYGQTFLRHVVGAKLAVELPWQLSAAAKLQLVFMSYSEPSALTSGKVAPLTIEDENRNALLVDLSRPIGRGFSLGARYALYRSGVSDAVLSYDRQVVFLGLTYRPMK